MPWDGRGANHGPQEAVRNTGREQKAQIAGRSTAVITLKTLLRGCRPARRGVREPVHVAAPGPPVAPVRGTRRFSPESTEAIMGLRAGVTARRA